MTGGKPYTFRHTQDKYAQTTKKFYAMGGAQAKTTLICVLLPGWQLVLNRIPYVRGIDLAEAHELVKHDVAAIVSYPLKPTGKRKTAEESEDETDDTPKPGPSKKKQKIEREKLETMARMSRKNVLEGHGTAGATGSSAFEEARDPDLVF